MEETTKILVVDDNPEIREIIQILLEGEGYAISQAENGAIALQLLSEESFDLIILDIMMPQLNGYQTCVRIRERSNAPILFERIRISSIKSLVDSVSSLLVSFFVNF